MAITTNLSLDQGSDFQATITLYSNNTQLLDLTGYGAQAQLRKSYDSTTASGVFTVAITSPTLGQLVLSMASTSTAVLKYGRYLYDVLIINSSTGVKTRAVEGIVTVMPRVTR
jgi:hypothetical protein